MENKEVEDCVLDITQGTHSLKHYPKNLKVITNYIEQLEKDNARLKKYEVADDAMIHAFMMGQKHIVAELEQQLQAKDKALNKACNKLSEEVYVETVDGYLDDERWKEWTENGID